MHTFHLAYCIDNVQTAERLESLLSPSGYQIAHHYGRKDHKEPHLAGRLMQTSGPVLLLVSDNFLKSSACMEGGLQLLQNRGDDILPIVIPGRDKSGGEPVRTQFERVSDIIQYINYWQEQYLDLRRQKKEISDLDEEAFGAHLKKVRSISGEAGEFLRLLRQLPHVDWDELLAQALEPVFQWVGDKEAWEKVAAGMDSLSPSAQTTDSDEELPDLSDIPGIELLDPSQHPGQPHAKEEDDNRDVPNDLEEDLLPGQSHDEEAKKEELETEDDQASEEVLEQTQESTGEAREEIDTRAKMLEAISKLLDEGRAGDAARLLEQQLHAEGPQVDLLFEKALLQAEHQGDMMGARETLDHLLLQEPDHLDALFLRAELAELSGQVERARDDYMRVADLNPNYSDIQYRLGMLLSNHFPDTDPKEVAQHLKAAIKAGDDHADALYHYALLQNEAFDKPEKAIKYLRKTIEAEPDHHSAHYDLALLYQRRGDHTAARECYRKAVEINPDLMTPENERVFSEEPVAESPQSEALPVDDTIAIMRENLSKLEDILRKRREEEARKAREAAENAKTVLLTGATSGIGLATAHLLAREGYRLIISGRRSEKLNELRHTFQEAYDNEDVLPVQLDVRDLKAVEHAIHHLPEEWQKIDILINNAGKAKGLAPIHEGQITHWEEMIDTNIKGLLYLTRLVSPGMVERQRGHIINIGSTAGKEVYPKGGVYCATKFAVDALTRSIRLDLHSFGIRVSQVSPGHVEETEFALVRFDGDREKARIYEDFQPLVAGDVAEAILFMITRPAHVNVQDILMMGTQQASATMIDRSGRERYDKKTREQED